MKSIKNLISRKEKEYIDNLEKLLDFIQLELIPFDFKYTEAKLKKLFLYQSLGDMFTKVSAICSLLKESKTIACNIIMRAVVESFINIEYVFADRKDDNLLKLYLEDSTEKIKLGNKVRDFYIRHKDFKPFGGEQDTVEYWDSYIEKAKAEIELIKKMKKKPTLDSLPNLKERAMFVDRIRKTNIEWWYITLYWLFSQDVHSTMRGLDNHMSKNEKEVFFELEGYIKDIEKISVTAYMILYSLTERMFDKFDFDKRKLAPFKKIFKSYGRRATALKS